VARTVRLELTFSAFGGLLFARRARYLCVSLMCDGVERNENITRLRGHSADASYLSAFGAKRKCGALWRRLPRSQMTQSGHKPGRNPALQRSPVHVLSFGGPA